MQQIAIYVQSPQPAAYIANSLDEAVEFLIDPKGLGLDAYSGNVKAIVAYPKNWERNTKCSIRIGLVRVELFRVSELPTLRKQLCLYCGQSSCVCY